MKELVFQSKVLSVISQLSAALANLRLYSHAHSLVGQHFERAYRELAELLEHTGDLTVFTVGDDLIVNNRTLLAAGPPVERFVRMIHEKGVEHITFLRGLSPEELGQLIQDLGSKESSTVRSWPFIKLGAVEIRVRTEGDASEQEPISGHSREVMSILGTLEKSDMDMLRELYLLAEEGKPISIRGVDDSVRKLVFEIRRNSNPLSLLATVKRNDEYTFTHVVNVCILTLIQAQRLGFGEKQLYDIGMASLLHDVGKTFIPEEILSKPGKLTTDERAIIETHPVKGGRYLMEVGGIPKIAVLAALEHHLRYDGTGYPVVKPGWKPSLVAQLITIADVFDALRSRRSYSDPKPMDQIVSILNQDKGTTFNPILVENFLEIVAPGAGGPAPTEEASRMAARPHVPEATA
ncbi:MAG: HD domain-containing protein [Syntrophobacteraceae bacterium]|jgi:HD-GYP domain-containing protein (c-di-GMP phosphodiesterase class II)|nr:HD domain-containing protein [Syntrophobacteraceae bacterium]